MSKIILTIFCILISLNLISQEETLNQSSIDFGIGGTNAVAPYAPNYWSNTIGLFHTYAAYRYMFNNKFGARIGVGFDRIKNDEFGDNGVSQEFRSQYFRSSLEIVLNMGRLLNFEDFAPKFSFLFHGGMGYSSNRNSTAPLFGNFDNPNKDNMVNFIVGITPQYKISNKLSMNLDLAFVNHIYQQRTWDLTQPVSSRGFDGFMANATIGISYYFGKNENHFDWKFDEKPLTKNEIIKEVYENMDIEELFNKLPDSDNDGIPDQLDGCPNEVGLAMYNGCPAPDKETKNDSTSDNSESKKESIDEEISSDNKENNSDPIEVEADIYKLFDHHELHIVVGMFKYKTNADNYVEELREKGYDADVVGISKGLKIVSVGSYDNVKEARKKLHQARSEIIETAWMMKRLKNY